MESDFHAPSVGSMSSVRAALRPLSPAWQGAGGEVGTMRAGRRAMGAPQGNSGGPPRNPSSSVARGLQRWRWWGGDGERAIRRELGEKKKKKRGLIAQWHLGD